MSDVSSKSSSRNGNARESLFNIVKRDDISAGKAILIRIGAIFAALLICALVTILLTKDNPISIYGTMLEGAFGSVDQWKLSYATAGHFSLPDQLWLTLNNISVLLIISLAVTPAFRMRFWNTGAEGQALAGALTSAVLMYYLGGKVPEWALIIIVALCGILAGMIWGLIPAFFKSVWNTNETLFTLMMNYVAIQLIDYFLNIAGGGSHVVGPNILTHGWIPELFGKKYLLTLILAVLLTVGMYVYLNYSKHGYEISVVGESQNTARYIGINVRKVIIRTMALSGAVCGLVGVLLVSGTSHSIDGNLVAGRGFTAIMVSWLAKFNPAVMFLASSLIVILERGAGAVSTRFGLNSSFSSILTGIILFFIIGCEFFINYRIRINRRKNDSENGGEEK